jgi:threonylcarbamoyladenosine tRNA methylthiotransferase MtaB
MTAPPIITLGCRLNHAESARIAALIGGKDVCVVNTCAVTAQAVRDSRRAVRRAARSGGRVVATGCAATIDPAGFGRMAEVVVNARKLDPDAYPNGPQRTAPAPQHTRAFVPVQTGCDHACTFCMIPQGRGRSVSRPVAEVVAEVAALPDAGVREVVLTGVDLTSYAAPGLGALVAAILREVPALARLRLSSLDGVEIDDRLFALLTGEPRVMPHVHLSLQSGDDLILKRMKRRHSRGLAIALVKRLKAARPDIAIGGDLIAGFPTEGEAAHANNLSLIEACDIVHGHVFPYSPRPGTPAARMPQVPPPLVRERAAELRATVAARRERWLRELVGTTHAVLAERDGTGHAPNFARFRVPEGHRPGAVVELTATRLDDGLLA